MKKFFNKIGTFISESYNELVHKVSWPTASELTNSAVVVLTASLVIALIVFVIDLGFENLMTFIYKVVGTGTDAMSNMTAGQQLDVLTGLGNGYDLSRSGDKPVLIGGGVGVPPMYYLAKQLIKAGKEVTVILGFNNASEIFYAKEFEEIGAKVYVTTVDGSVGTKGFVTDVLKTLDYSFFYTCGPMPMFRAIEAVATTDGQYSFEQRMGCGFGICMGCTHETHSGHKRICKEGPVLLKSDVVW